MARRRKKRMISEDFGVEAKQDSSWTLPLTIIGVTLLLSFGFVYYYFGPTISELRGDTPDPSASALPVNLTVGDVDLVVPTNYTRYPRARTPGVKESVSLYALLPDLEAFSSEKQDIFDSNESDSPVIYFTISAYDAALEENERLDRIYLEKVVDPKGRQGPYGLTVYEFIENSGYRDEDLFVDYGQDGGTVVIRCFKQLDHIPSPHCRRDMRLSDTLGLSYIYKRPWLAQWKEIDRNVKALTLSMRRSP